MKRTARFHISLFLLVFCSFGALRAQEAGVPEDNVFRLLQAERAQQMEQYGLNYRIVQGNARFLHNDTYLLCDSAAWNVDGRIIEAFGNVQIIQNKTALKSESMTYLIDSNMARFRGEVVELIDQDGNTLRTNFLDYNTRDSVGTFTMGGAVRDSSGNVIESRNGQYDGKLSMFTFDDEVELYMDSIEIKTTQLRYLTSESKALFGRNTYMWRGDGFIKSDAGSYNKETSVAYFADMVYMNNPQYEAWTDEVYYDQISGRVDMYHDSQILDTLHKSFYLADRIEYEPAPSPEDTAARWKDRVIMTDNPAIVYCGENENHQADTLYFRGDTVRIITRLRCDVTSEEVDEGNKLISDMEYDALAKTREDLAVEREKKRQESLREAGLLPPEGFGQSDNDSIPAAKDSLALAAADSLSVPAIDSLSAPVIDSLSAPVDSLQQVRDTTPVRYITSYRNVKVFRSDVQACCDSAAFNEVDSVARLFGRPVLWNAIKNQMTGETMYLLMKNGNLYRGSMITDSWVVSQEDSIHFHQIKSAEMLGYFYDNQLYRFDALGGVNAIFYLAENEVASTVNIKQSKSLTAMIKDGNAKRMLYMESIQSDAYPVSELVIEKQRLKGFEWRAAERPVSPEAITSKELKSTCREDYVDVKRPRYSEVNRYFDNYMVGKTIGAHPQQREAFSTSGDILEINP